MRPDMDSIVAFGCSLFNKILVLISMRNQIPYY